MKYREYVEQIRTRAERDRARGFPNSAACQLARAEKIEPAIRAAGLWNRKIGQYNRASELPVAPITVEDLIRHGCDADEAASIVALREGKSRAA